MKEGSVQQLWDSLKENIESVYSFDKSLCTIYVYCNNILLFKEFIRGRVKRKIRMEQIYKALEGTNSHIDLKYYYAEKNKAAQRRRKLKKLQTAISIKPNAV